MPEKNDSTKPELLPCPFCGKEKPNMTREYCDDDFGIFYFIKCYGCNASSRKHFASKGNDCPNFYSEVRGSWNTRA